MSGAPPASPVAPPSPFLRVARLLRPGGNPLARDVDRIESAVVLLCVLAALVLVPVMLTFGSVTFTSLAGQSSREVRDRVVATLTEDAPVTSTGTQGEVPVVTAKVPATWRLADGTTGTGVVDAPEGLKAGAEVPVWLDGSGTPAGAPLSTADAAAAGALVAAGGWCAVAGLFAAVCLLLHRLFDRRRFRAWDVEWARIGPGQSR